MAKKLSGHEQELKGLVTPCSGYIRPFVFLVIILSAGFVFDVLGLTWGLPEGSWHWDEKVRNVLHMAKNRTLNPHYYINPALHTYIVGLALLPYYLFLKLAGLVHNVTEWAQLPDGIKTQIMLIGRFVSIIFGMGTGLVVYKMGKKYINTLAGLLACMFLVISPGFITWSHYSTVDITSAFFLSLGMYYCLAIIVNPINRNYMLAGLFSGLALSCKYTGSFLIGFLVLAHVFGMINKTGALSLGNICGKQSTFRSLLMALMLIPAIFLIINPFVFISFSQFKQDFLHTAGSLKTYAGIKFHYFDWPVVRYFLMIFGGPSFIVIVISLIQLFRKAYAERNKRFVRLYMALISTGFLLYYNSLSFSMPRYMIIILPFCVLAMGDWLVQLLCSRKMLYRSVGLFLLAGAIGFQFYSAVCVSICFMTDPKDQAKKWIIEHIDDEASIHTHGFATYAEYPEYVNLDLPKTYNIVEIPQMRGVSTDRLELEAFISTYEKQRPDYIITSDLGNYGKYFSDRYHTESKIPLARYYRKLLSGEARYALEASFKHNFWLQNEFLTPLNLDVQIYKKVN